MCLKLRYIGLHVGLLFKNGSFRKNVLVTSIYIFAPNHIITNQNLISYDL